MRTRTANLIGWALIAVVTGICFVLNAMRIQYIYFNWFIIFTLVASAFLVAVQIYLARRASDSSDEEQNNRPGRPTS
jgi:hypothetical protein